MGILGQLFGTPPHRAVGDSGTTPPQLLEHHPFWDNSLEHHPNFWNITPFWDNILEHHPNVWNPPHPGFWDNFLEHHPIDATPTGQGRSSGATFGTPTHRAQTARVGHPPFAASKTAHLGPILWGPPHPPGGPHT